MALLTQPQFMQALSSIVMGRNGRESIEVAGAPVEVGDFLNLASVLTESALAQHHALVSNRSATLHGSVESVDPFVEPEERASSLWTMLQRESIESDDASIEDDTESDDVEADRILDEIELFELDADDGVLV